MFEREWAPLRSPARRHETPSLSRCTSNFEIFVFRFRETVLCGSGGKASAAGTDISQFREFNTTEDALGYERFMDSVRLMEAGEAHTLGLVTEVLSDCETLMKRASSPASELMQRAPLTLRATKEALRRLRGGNDVKDDDLILMCYLSEDFKEGLEAFLSKRRPQWKGR